MEFINVGLSIERTLDKAAEQNRMFNETDSDSASRIIDETAYKLGYCQGLLSSFIHMLEYEFGDERVAMLMKNRGMSIVYSSME